MKQQVNIKKLDDRAIIPTYGTAFSAGADLYACMDHAVTIAPGETYLVHTGISAAIPAGSHAQRAPRQADSDPQYKICPDNPVPVSPFLL